MRGQDHEKKAALRKYRLASDQDLTHWHGENMQDLMQDVFLVRRLRQHLDPK